MSQTTTNMRITIFDLLTELLRLLPLTDITSSRWKKLIRKLTWLRKRIKILMMENVNVRTSTPATYPKRPFQDVSNTRAAVGGRLARRDAVHSTPFKTPSSCRPTLKVHEHTTPSQPHDDCLDSSVADVFNDPVFRVPKNVTPKSLVLLKQAPNSLGRRRKSTTTSPGFIDSRRYEIVGLLGAGGFGSVYKARYKDQLYAVKKLHPCTKNEHAKYESYKAEVKARKLKHTNIIRIFATSDLDHPGGAVIVMEYAGDHNLQQIMFDHSQDISLERRTRFGIDISNALEFIHHNNIIHLDLKPANIMVTDGDVCKLGDFGCCQVVESDTGTVSPTQRSYLTGTFAYRAPELLRGEAPTKKADIYSLGITLWQMWSRELPYTGDHHVIIFAVVAYSLRPTIPHSDDPTELSYQKLLTSCWAAKPCMRPTAKEVYNGLKVNFDMISLRDKNSQERNE